MLTPIDYKQFDSKWGKIKYDKADGKSTIKSAGCGPTVMADILATLTGSDFFNPVTTCSFALMKGYKSKNQGTSYNYFKAHASLYGIYIEKINPVNIYKKPLSHYHDIAKEHLKEGKWLIALMGKGNWTSGGHYVLAYGYDNGDVLIADPASNKKSRLRNTWNLFKSQVKYYWLVENELVNGEWKENDFIREVQMSLGVNVDEKVGPETFGNTVTVSNKKNRKHHVVLPIQKILKKLGLYTSGLDCCAGPNFKKATELYQLAYVKNEEVTGEITRLGNTWRNLLNYWR